MLKWGLVLLVAIIYLVLKGEITTTVPVWFRHGVLFLIYGVLIVFGLISSFRKPYGYRTIVGIFILIVIGALSLERGLKLNIPWLKDAVSVSRYIAMFLIVVFWVKGRMRGN